jgi:hypothetical protein
MEKLQSALGFGGILPDEDRGKVFNHFRRKELKSNEHFHYMDHIAHEIAFVEQGVLRIYSSGPEMK